MQVSYRIVILLSTGSSYLRTYQTAEERDSDFVWISNMVNSGVGTFQFAQDIPKESSIIKAEATICVPRVVALEVQDVRISD